MFTHNNHPYLVEVKPDNCVYIPVSKIIKKGREYRKGTNLGSYKLFKIPLSSTIKITHISNNPLPQNDQIQHGEIREEKLEELLNTQN